MGRVSGLVTGLVWFVGLVWFWSLVAILAVHVHRPGALPPTRRPTAAWSTSTRGAGRMEPVRTQNGADRFSLHRVAAGPLREGTKTSESAAGSGPFLSALESAQEYVSEVRIRGRLGSTFATF